jgi:hypothetical protein
MLDLKRIGDKKYTNMNSNQPLGINNTNSAINGQSKLNSI